MRALWHRTTVRALGGQDATTPAPLRPRDPGYIGLSRPILGDGDAPTSPIKIQGYTAYQMDPDTQTITWTADRMTQGVSYYATELNESFLKVYT
jgi:hypothetical protein